MTFSASFQERYEILRPIGAGGMGEVFLARERKLDRQVAIKTVLSSHFVTEDGKARFLREARITGGLSHPNIIKVLDNGEDEGRLYIVFDFVEGGDLGHLLRQRGPFPPETFLALAIPIVDAVAHAHAAGILHRDIKADNVLVDAQGHPRLADFGLAKGGEDGGMRTATGLMMGTPRYMAPELGLGERASAASDQYALGVLLFEMLAGLPPFDAPQPMAILRMHIDSPVPPPVLYRPDIPADLEAIVVRTLAKRADQRFESVSALLAALRAFEEAAPPWIPRARPTAAADLSGSAVRVRRGTGRSGAMTPGTAAGTIAPGDVPDSSSPAAGRGAHPAVATIGPPTAAAGELRSLSAPAATIAPGEAPARGSAARNSGGVRRPTIRTMVLPPPPSRPAWLVPAGLLGLAAVIAAAFLLHSRGAVPRPSPTPAASLVGDPRYAALRFTLDRYRDHAVLRWTDGLPVAAIQATSSAGSTRSGTTTTSLTIPLSALTAARLDVQLTDPAGGARAFPALDFPAPTLESVRSALALLRSVPGHPGVDEARITWLFNHAFRVNGKLPRFDARYRLGKATRDRARIESFLGEAMARRNAHALRPLLEQAALLLDAPGPWREKARVYEQAHQLANLEAFCANNGFTDSIEALRFLYGLQPGPFPLLTRPVLNGDADYSRRLWRSDLLAGSEDTMIIQLLGAAPTRRTRTVKYEDCAAKLPSDGDPLEVASTPNHAMALEYVAQTGHGGLTSYVRRPVPLFPELFAPADNAKFRVAKVVVDTRLTERAHLDLRRGTELVLCLRLPPGHTDSPDSFAAVRLAAICETEALTQATPPTTIALYTADGDGAVEDSWDHRFGWVAQVGRILVHITDQ